MTWLEPGYDKNIDVRKFMDRVDDATARAKALDAGEGCGPNPSTGMWRIVELVRPAGRPGESGRTRH